MEDELKAILSKLGSEFARVSGRKLTGIWASAVNDARFMERVEAGQTFTVKTLAKAMQWFSDNWPVGAVWPDGVKRPERSCDGAAA